MTEEMSIKLAQMEKASLERYQAIEPDFASQEALTKSFEALFGVEGNGAMHISGCVRLFCDWSAWMGLWSCTEKVEGDYILSASLARLLIHWNSWYEYLIKAVSDCNRLYESYEEDLELTPDSIRREGFLFCRVGLRIAEWVKLENPQCKVFYLTEWAFDDMIYAEYEVMLNEDGTFHYRCDRILGEDH